MTRVLAVLAVVSACSVASGCNHTGVNTQVMVTVDAEPGVRAMARTLVIRVYGGPRGTAPSDLVLAQDVPAPVSRASAWPYLVALAPHDRDASRIYRVEAIAFATATPNADTDTPIARVRAISGYVPDQTVSLRLVLEDACVGVSCSDVATTCSRHMCVDAHRDAASLPPWTPNGMDASTDAPGSDARVDGGMDAASTDSSSTVDGGLPDAHRCTAAECDDMNVCTDDVCSGATGLCSHANNTAGCDDGVFCNGTDQCAAAACTLHSGNPCLSGTTCAEVSHQCVGCTTAAQCPMPSASAWGACQFSIACTTAGTQTRTTTTYTCPAGSCIPSMGTDTQPCMRASTNGNSCGTTSCGAYGACTPTTTPFPNCGPQPGMAMRTCTDLVCMGGTCGSSPRLETGSCSYAPIDGDACTDGNPCTGPDSCFGGVCQGLPICAPDAGPDMGMTLPDMGMTLPDMGMTPPDMGMALTPPDMGMTPSDMGMTPPPPP